MSCEKCGEEMKRKRSWAYNGCPIIIRYCDCVEVAAGLNNVVVKDVMNQHTDNVKIVK